MFERCICCGDTVIVSAVRDENGAFCSESCRSFYKNPGFCSSCVEATTPESAGNLIQVNGCGRGFYGSRDRCPTCGSVVRTKCFCILLIPLIPLERYRVLHIGSTRYLSRRLTD
jgi:hypothetical protein